MLKKAMMLAFAAAALAAFVIPATASAVWTKDHVVLQTSDTIQVTGQVSFHGELGTIECQTDATAQLLAGQTTASVKQFEVDLTSGGTVTDKCSVAGGLAGLGCTDVASMTTEGLPWTAHAVSTTTVSITTGTIQTHLHGGTFCPKTIQMTPGTLHLTTNTDFTWSTGGITGQLQGHTSFGANNPVAYTSHVLITPSGRYGVL